MFSSGAPASVESARAPVHPGTRSVAGAGIPVATPGTCCRLGVGSQDELKVAPPEPGSFPGAWQLPRLALGK